MVTHKRQSLVFFISALLLLSIILGLKLTSPARADVGVRPILPAGSNIVPAEETPIQMATEVVTMNVRLATEADNAIVQLNPEAYGLQLHPVWYTLVAEVQAEFTMYNPTTGDISLTTLFPLASSLGSVSWELNPDEIVPRITSFKVQVDGKPLDYTLIELPNPQGADKPLLPWASFPVSFPAGTNTSIHVSYLFPLTRAVKGTELALNYTFQSGAGWAGPIGKAELTLHLPYPYARLEETIVRVDPSHLDLPYHISYPIGQDYSFGDPDEYKVHWSWGNFEPTPQDDFFAWLIDPELWQGLQDAWMSIAADQENGQAWLTIASRCRNVAIKAYNVPSIFYDVYFEMCFAAYDTAEYLLPDHPAPYIGLASMSLAAAIWDPIDLADMIHQVQDQLETAKELEQAHPEWANEGDLTTSMVEDGLSIYFANVTATAEIYASGTAAVKQTEAATLREIPSVTPTTEPRLTLTVMPSASPEPSTSTPAPTLSSETRMQLDGVQIVVIIAAAAFTIVAIAGFVVLGRIRRKI